MKLKAPPLFCSDWLSDFCEAEDCNSGYSYWADLVIDLETRTFIYQDSVACADLRKDNLQICDIERTITDENTISGEIDPNGWLLGSGTHTYFADWVHVNCEDEPDHVESQSPSSSLVARPTADLASLQVGFYRQDIQLDFGWLSGRGYQSIAEMDADWPGLQRTFECTLVSGE